MSASSSATANQNSPFSVVGGGGSGKQTAGGAGGGFSPTPLMIGAAVLALAALAFVLWRKR